MFEHPSKLTLGQAALEVGRQLRQRIHQRELQPGWPLPSAIEAERHVIASADAGTISYYEDRSAAGRPLVLIHGVHAAASSYEMRPLFDLFRAERPVYALDLPGFGFSQRGGMRYTPETYVQAVAHVLRHIADERSEDRADIVALSLSSEYAARVAIEMPELVHSLVMLSPTGFGTPKETSSLQLGARRDGGSVKLWGALANVGGELLFDLLVSRKSLSHYLRKQFCGRVDPNLLEYSYLTSHQPNAECAPLAFVAGDLFPKGDPKRNYAEVKVPVLVLYDEDPHTGFGALRSFIQTHANYHSARVLSTRGLPQIEARERTVRALRCFWERTELELEDQARPSWLRIATDATQHH
jgi:pimeloyl-ACP methyl ester carboxylesterase